MGNQNNNVLNWEETFAKLSAPFSPDDVGWRIGSTFLNNNVLKGIAVPYASNRAIQKRLDETFGVFGWKNEYKGWLKESQLCGISVRVVYEDGSCEWVTKWDGAECTDIEPIKGGLSDSMKRSASQWSIGRYLYDIEKQYVEVEEKGKSKFIAKKELIRLKTVLSGKNYTSTLSEDKTTSSNLTEDKKNTDKNNSNTTGNSNASQNEKKDAVVTSVNTNQTSNKPNTSGKGSVSGGKASPKQVGFIKSLLSKSNNSIETILTKYGVTDLNGLTVGQVQEVIKSLMAIAS